METMNNQQIVPFLWFDSNAEEAITFYSSIFKEARMIDSARYPETGPGPAGSLMTATFELNGQRFVALNGGPQFQFTEAVSFMVRCKTQEEVDHYWNKLTADGGEESQCGWLKDKFGLSWQIVPDRLMELIKSTDPQLSMRVMQAMMQMQKIDIAKLEAAAAAK